MLLAQIDVVVPPVGLEPTPLTGQASKTCVSANFTTAA